MTDFEKLWSDLEERSRRWAIPIVQNYQELEYVFNLIKDSECESYLEVGTAEGNSLYVLAQALKKKPGIFIHFNEADEEMGSTTRPLVQVCEIVDFGETHTKKPREEVISILRGQDICITENYGNSHNTEAKYGEYDIVLIDAGHSYEDVIADARAFGHLANKYIIFHDIQLPPVKAAFDWYCKQNPQFKVSSFINSESFGYGILEVNK